MLEANTLRLEKLPGDLAGPGQAHDQGDPSKGLRLQGQKWQQLLNVGNAFQTVYPLYDSLGP